MAWTHKDKKEILEAIKDSKEDIKRVKTWPDDSFYKEACIKTYELHIKLLREQIKERGL